MGHVVERDCVARSRLGGGPRQNAGEPDAVWRYNRKAVRNALGVMIGLRPSPVLLKSLHYRKAQRKDLRCRSVCTLWLRC